MNRVEIQGDLTKLGHQFRDCPNLEEVVLSSGISSLNGTFYNCPKLKTINLDNVTALKSHSTYAAFQNCTALTEVNLPNAAEILREQEFRPTELIDAGPWSKLPYDVGFFSQEPGITLWCYPNDTPEDVLGVPRPSLEFECKIRGETCSFSVPLPPLPRGSSREVELTVDGPGSFHYKFR